MQQKNKTENIQNITLKRGDSPGDNRNIAAKIFLAVFVLLVAGSVAASFYRFMVNRNYIVQAQVDCDPETENCFIWECDPMSLEEGEACTGIPDNDIWYYKLLERKASNVPDCDPDDEECDALVCAENEPECRETLCDTENVPEGEICSNPEQYLLENPPEECEEDDEECLIEEECEEGDEECLAQTEEECDPDDGDCLASETEEECAPDDEECLAEEAEADTGEAEESIEECAPGDEECAVSEEAEEDSSQNENDTESSEENENVSPKGVEPL